MNLQKFREFLGKQFDGVYDHETKIVDAIEAVMEWLPKEESSRPDTATRGPEPTKLESHWIDKEDPPPCYACELHSKRESRKCPCFCHKPSKPEMARQTGEGESVAPGGVLRPPKPEKCSHPSIEPGKISECKDCGFVGTFLHNPEPQRDTYTRVEVTALLLESEAKEREFRRALLDVVRSVALSIGKWETYYEDGKKIKKEQYRREFHDKIEALRKRFT